ncbi:MAG: hypothetical protein Q9169_007971 [Polycauliona sp. 2 TL-2023]
MICESCSLTFFPETSVLEDTFDRVTVSEEAVARQQIEEDMRLYGMRPEPSDTVIDRHHHDYNTMIKAPSKRDASAVETFNERPAKTRKIDEDDGHSQGNQTLTAMDWNSGASPLESWLNQSAIPSSAPVHESSERTQSLACSAALELEEIKIFRSVHLHAAPLPENQNAADEDFASLRQGAQIYYRNIKDKFALIPTYLARRLANANLDRAAALQRKRHLYDDDVKAPRMVDESCKILVIDHSRVLSVAIPSPESIYYDGTPRSAHQDEAGPEALIDRNKPLINQ